MRPDEFGNLLDLHGSARAALLQGLSSTALDATIARLASNPALDMIRWSNVSLEAAQRLAEFRDSQTLAAHVFREVSWGDSIRALATRSTWDTTAAVYEAQVEIAAIFRRAGVSDDMRVRFASMTCDSLAARWKALIPQTHDLFATYVLPEIASAQRYLAMIDFSALRVSLGSVMAEAVEHRLYRTSKLLDARISAALPSVADADEEESASSSRGVVLASRTLRWSSRTVFELPAPPSKKAASLRVDARLARLLREVHPGLAEAYVGAVIAYNRRDRDWRRHVGVSLRELLDNFVKILAPSERVEPWLRQRGTPGTVSRRRRLQDLKESKADAEVRHLEAQWALVDELAEALNAPTHELNYPNSRALRGYIKSAEGFLILILETVRHEE
jgi:hypothetical protein